jgi:putative transposase
MGRRTPKRGAGQEARALGLASALEPLLEGAERTRATLLEMVCRAGMMVVLETFGREAEMVAGPKHAKRAERAAHHWGRTNTEMTLGGRRVVLPRPRVRSLDGREVTLPSVELFRNEDPLRQRILEQILLGVSTRRYAESLEHLDVNVRTRSTSRSAVSRRFVAETRRRVEDELSRPLDDVEAAVLFFDGIVVDEKSLVVALAVDRAGKKHVLGLRLGSTENATLCTELLQEILSRGLKLPPRVLCVVDGGTGIRKALRDVLGDSALVQRCQIHKMRNVEGYLPRSRASHVVRTMREAYRAGTVKDARARLQRLASWLERNGDEDAARSLREGLEETLTVLKLGLPSLLTRSLSTTNAIENLMGSIRRVTARVARWRSGGMIRRWVGAAVLHAQKRFKRLRGHRDLPHLLAALSAPVIARDAEAA